jgi:pimeloyl-ACP methyl ester carboxylesterase
MKFAPLVCLLASGCIHFQTGPSAKLPVAERVQIAGRGQLHVLDLNTGAAQTVLLVHGYGASVSSWKPVLPELRKRFRVIAVDLPGFGKSDAREGDYSVDALADTLAQILDEKGINRVHLAGHSWGTAVAMAFVRRHRERVDKLVLISGFLYDDQLLPLFRWARASGVGEALYRMVYSGGAGERLYFNFVDPNQVTEEVADEVERTLDQPGHLAALLAAARGMRFADGEYAKVDADTLLVWGREDRVARLAFGERLARELPRARLVVLPRCGHLPMWECTGQTAAALIEFLGSP